MHETNTTLHGSILSFLIAAPGLEGLRSGPGTTIRSKADWAKFWKKIDADIKAHA